MTATSTDIDAQDAADMAQLAAGQDPALNRLMERHATTVFHFLARLVGNEEDANDLAQETFVRVYQARDRFRAGRRFSSWLFTIAANLGRNHLRWRARHPAVSMHAQADEEGRGLLDTLPADARRPDEAAEAEEVAKAVRAAVQELPEELREAVVLCEWQDLSLARAAEVLETTPKAVETRLYRARKQLRERLGRWLS